MRARRQVLSSVISAEPWGATVRAALPAGCAGGWVSLRAESAAARCWMKLELTDRARGQLVREVFLLPPRRRRDGQCRETLVHVPASADAVVLRVFGAVPEGLRISVRRSGRAETALRLLAFGWRRIGECLRGSPLGLVGRSRALIGQAPARAGDVPPYSAWIEFFEAKVPAPRSAGPEMVAVVLGGRDGADGTLHSLEAQTRPPARVVFVESAADWRAVGAVWAVLLQAGETLHAHALDWFAWTVAAWPDAAFITADCDRVDVAGQRGEPLFKPGADPRMADGNLLSWGACAVRLGDDLEGLPLRAEDVRQVLARRAGAALAHVPRVLTHCRSLPNTPAPTPPGALPINPAGAAPLVTAIVPSTLRMRSAARCIAAMARSGGNALHVMVAVSAPDQVSPRVWRHLTKLWNVTLHSVQMPVFNYAAVNNRAAGNIQSQFILLLNDDVAPQNSLWLSAMLDEMRDPAVGIVGARLLYGNGLVQHEGVIMGLANLAEHAGRLRPGADPGRHGIGLRSRQVSAVTAACLLIRTSVFQDLGGMDEKFVIALNDVDLCLRARAAGIGVVYCAGAELVHYESLSLGRHYDGPRAGLEAFETKRLRDRWGDVIASDPYYNAQSSLIPGQEWQPAFPPRGPGFTASATESGAPHCHGCD